LYFPFPVQPFPVRPSRSVRLAQVRESPLDGPLAQPSGPERLAAKVRNFPAEAVAGDVDLDMQHGSLLSYQPHTIM
jgi:hypothetical protein